MDIKIVHRWLLEYLETNANPTEIGQYLSLAGPSVEKIEKIGDEYVYDIEITSNRIDSASVFGIGQECQAILPSFGKQARLKLNPLDKYKLSSVKLNSLGKNFPLQVQIKDKNLCSRFTAVVLDNVKIGPSPPFIKKRLNLCGIKSINNVVDISNYLMISLGQPTHTFDYEKISKHKMIMRKSRKGEKIITLDKKEIDLPGGDIVIEDGEGKLIDLCGIMGGLNSSVTKTTKKILFFVQTYNKQKIRRTAMITGQRTVAATYFEKGLDEERVGPALAYGVKLFKKYASAKIGSKVYDIYPQPYKEKTMVIKKTIFEKMMGVKVSFQKIKKILPNLGFRLKKSPSPSLLKIGIPSYRRDDVAIPQDIVEEVARIYGYHNLPNRLSPPAYAEQPKEFDQLFFVENKIKHFLKNLGLNEVMNYSMISEELVKKFSLDPKKHLRLANTISQEIEYMRKSLIPSLAKNMNDNFGKEDRLKFFEIAKIYPPRRNNLPQERYKLAMAVNSDFFDLKGMVQALFIELNITSIDWHSSIKKNSFYNRFFDPGVQATVFIKKEPIVFLGQLKTDKKIFVAEIEFKGLVDNFKPFPVYKPINPYAVIKLDLTLSLSKKHNFLAVKKTALKKSKLIKKIELVSLFQNKAALRFYFSSPERNITKIEAKQELEKIIKALALK